jgi:hypothetical protein
MMVRTEVFRTMTRCNSVTCTGVRGEQQHSALIFLCAVCTLSANGFGRVDLRLH